VFSRLTNKTRKHSNDQNFVKNERNDDDDDDDDDDDVDDVVSNKRLSFFKPALTYVGNLIEFLVRNR